MQVKAHVKACLLPRRPLSSYPARAHITLIPPRRSHWGGSLDGAQQRRGAMCDEKQKDLIVLE
jgi:hypothetical protein